MGSALGCCAESRSRNEGGVPGRVFYPPVGTEPAKELNGEAPQSCRATRALLIGINYEGTRAALKGCQNDALDMKALLMRQYGYQEPNVRLLLDRPGFDYPSMSNIMSAAGWLVEGAKPGDCLFFHFSGHGAQQEDPKCAEEDGMDETILPADFMSEGQLIDDELFEIIVRPLPSGVKLTAVMDCCHSGTGLDLPFTYHATGSNWGTSGSGKWVCDDNPCHSEGHVILLSGCCDDQTSADVQRMYQKPRGAMTEAFIETLMSMQSPTFPQLLEGLRQRLAAHGHTQRPQLTSSQAFDIQCPFESCGGVCPNKNPVIGRQLNKRKYPRRNIFPDGDPLAEILVGTMVAEAAFGGGLFDVFGGGIFGGGLGFGDDLVAFADGDFMGDDCDYGD